MQKIPFNFSIWLYEIHSSSNVSPTASYKRGFIQDIILCYYSFSFFKISSREINFTIPAMDFMLLRPKERIFKCFMPFRLLIRSMQFDDSESFLQITTRYHVI